MMIVIVQWYNILSSLLPSLIIPSLAAQRSMGLCPQFDTLIERLSVRENLQFFGAIKGLPEDALEKVSWDGYLYIVMYVH